MKTKEELNALREEVETICKKLAELTEDELQQVTGGHNMPKINPDEKYVMQTFSTPEDQNQYEFHLYK